MTAAIPISISESTSQALLVAFARVMLLVLRMGSEIFPDLCHDQHRGQEAERDIPPDLNCLLHVIPSSR